MTYIWSKSIDDSSQADDNVTWLGSFTSLQDPNKPWLERSLSTFDIPHVVQFSYSYDLPFGRGRAFFGNMPRWADAIHRWMEDERNLAHRRRPAADLSPSQTETRCRPMAYSVRTSLAHRSAIMARIGWTSISWITACSSVRPTSHWATRRAPSEAFGRPWSFTTDLSLAKQFAIREEMNIEVRIEAQNAFNHPVFGTPNTPVDDRSFGQITSTSQRAAAGAVGSKFNF